MKNIALSCLFVKDRPWLRVHPSLWREFLQQENPKGGKLGKQNLDFPQHWKPGQEE
jgi:hypothetical protein